MLGHTLCNIYKSGRCYQWVTVYLNYPTEGALDAPAIVHSLAPGSHWFPGVCSWTESLLTVVFTGWNYMYFFWQQKSRGGHSFLKRKDGRKCKWPIIALLLEIDDPFHSVYTCEHILRCTPMCSHTSVYIGWSCWFYHISGFFLCFTVPCR